MSVTGPRHCFCCGRVESTTGCVRGMRCDCNQNPGGWCKVCKYCLTHCQCTDGMKQAASDAHVEYIKTLMKIAESNPERINKRW